MTFDDVMFLAIFAGLGLTAATFWSELARWRRARVVAARQDAADHALHGRRMSLRDQPHLTVDTLVPDQANPLLRPQGFCGVAEPAANEAFNHSSATGYIRLNGSQSG